MRILLVTGNQPSRSDLARMLEARGHQVIQANAIGGELLGAVERAGRLNAALLGQAVLGRGWPRLLRQLRRRAPYLPVVFLLGPGAEQAWRIAILAGAFDALPASLPDEAVFRALVRALSYAVGRSLAEPSPPKSAPAQMERSSRAILVEGLPAGAMKSRMARRKGHSNSPMRPTGDGQSVALEESAS